MCDRSPLHAGAILAGLALLAGAALAGCVPVAVTPSALRIPSSPPTEVSAQAPAGSVPAPALSAVAPVTTTAAPLAETGGASPPPSPDLATAAPTQPLLSATRVSPSVTPSPSAPPPPVPETPAPPSVSTLTPTQTRTPVQGPAVDIVVDDADPGFSYTGAWFTGDGGASYGRGCHWAPPGPNAAAFKPALPVAGSYEIYVWGCGDPNHDQAYLTNVSVYPFPRGFYVPPQAAVNLKEDAGRWVSVGVYYMEPGGWVTLGSGNQDAGSGVADAVRFVFRWPEHRDVTPTPAPTRITSTNHPPSPQEQLTSGDLGARLGVVQWLYPYTPAQFESTSFDDCQAFPRAGCGGTRPGWRVTVSYLGREPFSVAYRVSEDLHHVSLDAPQELRTRQLYWLSGRNGLRSFAVLRYPDGSWQLVTNRGYGSGGKPLSEGEAAVVRGLADRYASIGTGRERVVTPDGWELQLYGLGTRAALDENDRANLTALADALGASEPP